MKYIVLGKKLKTIWEIKDNRISIKNSDEMKKIFTAKPELTNKVVAFEYPEILRFEGELGYNYNTSTSLFYSLHNCFNISAEETVYIEKKIFRADENLTYIYTDKVCEQIDENKEEAENAYKNILKEFNKTMIKSNPTMDNYCELHHLNYGMTDCYNLFEYLFPNKTAVIKDGKMTEKVYDEFCTSTSIKESLLYCNNVKQ